MMLHVGANSAVCTGGRVLSCHQPQTGEDSGYPAPIQSHWNLGQALYYIGFSAEWSGWWESNPHNQLGKLELFH